MSQKFAIIGLGRFGRRLAMLLAKGGGEVIAIDRRKDRIESIKDDVTLAVCLDATDEDALKSQGIGNVDCAIVGIGSQFESAVLTTVLLKQIGVPRVITRATNTMRGDILSRIGADEVVNPERESAEKWRMRLLGSGFADRIELAEDYSLIKMIAPEPFIGKTLGELDVRKNFHIQVVAIRRQVEDTNADGTKRCHEIVISVPMADTLIKPEDTLLVIGSEDAIKNLSE
ncbi:MAG: TrkA family potassium uptake protein [Phycisphaerales bacterium]|jgi:trk system potassium uptake protein|nr:TrkA family potassium uptake protein [Phycisphaerales bacterium]MBT7170875.1 TrkA family potassium uptake protein [Phycisphaerales bacterium]